MCFVLINISCLSHVSFSLPQCPPTLSILPPSSLCLFFHSLSMSAANIPPCLLLCSSSLTLSHHLSSTPQSVIVKSVERNAVNMYEARKFLLGLESNGVSSSSPPVVLNPTPNGPSPSLICPVGLDILASAGLGLSSLGNGSGQGFLFAPLSSTHTEGLLSEEVVVHQKHKNTQTSACYPGWYDCVCFLLLWRWTAGMSNIQTSLALITIPIFAVFGDFCPVCLWIELLFKMILALEPGASSNPE